MNIFFWSVTVVSKVEIQYETFIKNMCNNLNYFGLN